jgi:hypothetical protein
MHVAIIVFLINVISLLPFIELPFSSGTDDDPGGYVGADRCKLCHQRDMIYQSWSESAHARAWWALDSQSQTNDSCIYCHSTGENDLGELLTGVQCEACHGPGKDHKRLILAESEEAAKTAGTTFINEKTCTRCHNQNIPEQFRPDKPFDSGKAVARGVHARRANARQLLEGH